MRDPAGTTRITSGASKESMNLCPEWIHRFHQLVHHDRSDPARITDPDPDLHKGKLSKVSSYICTASVTKANVHTEQD